jgi:lysophospholipase L1-like esterase
MRLTYLLFLKLSLAPILLWQGRRTRAQTIRLPEAAGERNGLVGVVGETHDQTPYRLLVIGDSSAAGVGASTQSEALASQTATALAQQLQRPVAWQLIAQSGLNTARAHAFFRESNAGPADAALFALGVNDATSQVKDSKFIAESNALWKTVQKTTGAKLAVFSGLPPVHDFPALPQPLRFYLGTWVMWLDDSLRAWTLKQGLIYCPVSDTLGNASVKDMASDGYHPGPKIYAAWAQQAAILIANKVRVA